MTQKVFNMLFLVGMLVFLLISLGRAVFFPIPVNTYENRKAEQFKSITLKAFLDGSLQSNMESTLSDQAPFAMGMKEGYNKALSAYLRAPVLSLAAQNPNRYILLGDHFLFGPQQLLYGTGCLDWWIGAIDTRAAQYNALFEKYPELDFYCYYIEKETDINFQTNEKVGAAEYYGSKLNLPENRFGFFAVNDFASFSKAFYRTDHHWKAEGSDRAYREVLALLAPEEKPLTPGELILLDKHFSGSKAKGETVGFSESFSAYRYSYPSMDIVENGIPVSDYGKQKEYFNGFFEPISYSTFYGGDMGEVLFDTHRPHLENLLIVGESYDNAILKLLASHFNRTVSIDQRYYQAYMGKSFSFGDCVRTHEIDKVLFIGNIDFLVGESFKVEE